MAAPDVHLVEMGYAAVAGGDCDVFELDVHVVFGCFESVRSFLHRVVWGGVERCRCVWEGGRRMKVCIGVGMGRRTL